MVYLGAWHMASTTLKSVHQNAYPYPMHAVAIVNGNGGGAAGCSFKLMKTLQEEYQCLIGGLLKN